MAAGISRRTFTGALAATTLGAVAATEASVARASEAPTTPASMAASEQQEYTCDIAIVGSGSSGLAACVQAAELGASVICIERMATIGGNGQLTDGVFGAGSSMQKAEGIEADCGVLVREELRDSQFRGSGAALSDMVKASGENIDWLLEQGVTFALVDHETFHSFTGGFEGAGGEHYARPMEAKARELGVTFLTETLATSLVKDETGAVCGVEAEGPDGAVHVNAKAVIMGGGGFVQNKELMERYFGIDIDTEATFLGLDGHDGSVIQMALDAGAKTNMTRAGLQGCLQVIGLPTYLEGGHFSGKLENYPFPGIWVNEDGTRFVNEDCGENNWSLSELATIVNEKTYVLFDENAYTTFVDNLEDQPGRDVIDAELEEAVGAGLIFRADTWERAAEQAGLDPQALAETVRGYNQLVEAGADTDFGKRPEYLAALATPPFLVIPVGHLVICSFAGVTTDRACRALDEAGAPIPGLYVIGLDGAMLWANEYTLTLPAGTNGFNVYSGRMAAQRAVATYLA